MGEADRRPRRKLLDDELSWLLLHLREIQGLSLEEVATRLCLPVKSLRARETRGALALDFEDLLRHAQALGLGLRLEFVDGEGRVVARYPGGLEEENETPA